MPADVCLVLHQLLFKGNVVLNRIHTLFIRDLIRLVRLEAASKLRQSAASIGIAPAQDLLVFAQALFKLATNYLPE